MYNFLEIKEPKLRNIILFELISWYGRKFQKIWKNNRYKKWITPVLIDFGCGNNIKQGWINADFFQLPNIKFRRKKVKRRKLDFELDLRYPIGLPENHADGIYSGHTLEHLYPRQAVNFLTEVYRILKPGAWLRINVPDLACFVEFYKGIIPAEEFKVYNSGCEAICELTQDSGHHSVWDEQLLSSMLKNIGFTGIKRVEFGVEGTDKRLIKEEEIRKWSTLVVEAQKPD